MTVAIICERVARINSLINEIFVAAPVKLARTRLHRDSEETTAGLSKFRSIVTSLNGNFLDGIRTRLIFLQRETYGVVRVVQPFKAIGGGVRRRSVHDHRQVCCVVDAWNG